MKSKSTATRCLYLVIAAIVLLAVPTFFHRYPHLRFLWGVGCAIGICTQFYSLIKYKERRTLSAANILLLLLSCLIAYDMFNWETLVSIFPILEDISQQRAMLVILGGLIAAGAIGGIWAVFVRHWVEDTRREPTNHFASGGQPERKANTVDQGKGVKPAETGTGEMAGKMMNRLSFRQVAGFLIGLVLTVTLLSAAAYFLLKNEQLLTSLKLQSVKTFVNASAWLMLVLCLGTLMIVSMAYVIWLIRTVVADTLRDKNFTIDNPSFLKLISFTMIMVLGVMFYNTDLDGWFLFMKRPDEIAPVLKGLLMIFLLLMLSQVAYRMLYSFFSHDGCIRKQANLISDQFFKCGVGVLSNLLVPFTDVPRIIKLLSAAFFPRLIKWIKDYFFDADVSKTGLEKKIWYPFAWGSLLFAIVSFFGTANGMTGSFFKGHPFAAYALSFGVQVFLLTFNLHLPKLISERAKVRKKYVVVLYIATLLGSAFFNYAYISTSVYSQTWTQYAHLELTDTFLTSRSKLEAMTASIYSNTATELSKDITTVQNSLPIDVDQIEKPDFSAIKAGFDTDSEVKNIADALSAADTTSAGSFEKYGESLNGKVEDLTANNVTIETEIENLKDAIASCENEINSLIDVRYGVNINSPAHISYTESIERAEEKQKEAEKEKGEKILARDKNNKKINLLNELITYLHLLEAQPGARVSVQFSEILTQLLSPEPNIELINNAITEISHELTRSNGMQGEQSALVLETIARFKSNLSLLQTVNNCRDWLESENAIYEAEKFINGHMKKEDKDDWRTQWNTTISVVESYLRSVEPYTGVSDTAAIEGLTEELSMLKQTYLLELSDVQTALGQFTSSHSSMARLSAIIALYLDAAPVLVSFLFSGSGEPDSVRKKTARTIAAGANLFLVCLIAVQFLSLIK